MHDEKHLEDITLEGKTFLEKDPAHPLWDLVPRSILNLFLLHCMLFMILIKVITAPKFYELPFSHKLQLKLRFIPIQFTRRSEKRSNGAPLESPLGREPRAFHGKTQRYLSFYLALPSCVWQYSREGEKQCTIVHNRRGEECDSERWVEGRGGVREKERR